MAQDLATSATDGKSSNIATSFGGNFLTRQLTRTMSEVLPRRFKRSFYVSSVLGLFIQRKNPDTELVTRINRKLKLSCGPMAMLFPIYFGSVIWKSVMSNVINLQVGSLTLSEICAANLTENDYWRTGLHLARNAPGWLQYGSSELMAADVHDLLKSLNRKAA